MLRNSWDRLQSFDGDPLGFRDLWNLSKYKYPELPNDPYDVDTWLTAAVKAEACAIEHYREIYEYVSSNDPVIEEIIENIVKDEAEHETIFRTLLSKGRARKV